MFEIAIKIRIGKLRFPKPAEEFLLQQLAVNRIEVLNISARHSLAVLNLPGHHKDPFDLLLIAQCQIEQLPILTDDEAIKQYSVESLW